MADCAAIKTKLDEALAAYHRLATGESVRVIVDTDGSRLEYNAANRSALYAYIQKLQTDYNACIGQPAPIATRPLNFHF